MKTIEEKAKAYDEAIETARKLNNGEGVEAPPDWTVCEVIFPELRKSEDEKIRKWIIDDIRYNMNNEPLNNSEYKKKAEKAITWLEKQRKETSYGQREECVDCQFNYAGECKGSCAMKRSERKPTEWSEEDEVELNGLIKHYEDGHVSTPQNRKTIKWLKSLKQRMGG